jgi:hypothetical protein
MTAPAPLPTITDATAWHNRAVSDSRDVDHTKSSTLGNWSTAIRESSLPFQGSRKAMKNRRKFLTVLTTGLVALSVVVGSAFADELLGVLTKVDVEGKKVTVLEKDTDKEVIVTITGDTEYVTKKGSSKIDLEKVDGNVKKAIEKGAKGITVTVTHEKGVASKIAPVFKKKTAIKGN